MYTSFYGFIQMLINRNIIFGTIVLFSFIPDHYSKGSVDLYTTRHFR